MKIKNKTVMGVLILAAMMIFAAGVDWILILRKAHSTFENYYAFRGCQRLVSKTNDAGYCKLASGQIIKIVKFKNKWYLDGDLPCGFMCF